MFLKGKMNLDADERILSDGEYREALNIRVANSEGSDVGAIEKSLSNKALTALVLGNNVFTLASLRDEFEEKIYWAVLSDNGCYIIEYEVGTDTTTFVLQDTRSGALNILGFSPTKRLQMALIVDSDNDNRLLAFTDDNTQPKLINIERAKGYAIDGFDEEDILLIKKPPLFAPTIVLNSTPDVENNIEEKFIQFFSRYKYLDGEYSALSPASDVAFYGKTFKYDYNTGTNESMVNFYNSVAIDVNTGSDLVTDVEVVFKESGSNTLYLVETFNKDYKGWADNILLSSVSEEIEFTNNKIYRILPEKELFRLYDNVPLLAKALTVINNRIVFGDYTENYDLVDNLDAVVNIELTPSLLSTTISNDLATKSVKSNRDYEIAISYLDDYGRMTTPLTSENNSLHVANSSSVTKNEIKVEISNKPPVFATYYRFFIKQNKTDYDTLLPSLFYEDGDYRWVKIEKSDIDKIKEGDYLVVKSDSSNVLSSFVKTKVLEIKEQSQNFLQPEDDVLNEIIEKPGLYFKIKPKNFSVNKEDYYNYNIQTYHNSRDRYNDVLQGGTAYTSPAVYYGNTDINDDMTVLATNSLSSNTGKRFKVIIDNLQLAATGSVELTGGASGSVDGITVNGVQIMSIAEPFATDLPTTATNVASNITANTSSPNYTASAVGSVITITSVIEGTSPNGFAVVSTATTITTTDVNMSGGAENTFKWNDDNSDTYLAINSDIPITAGVGQVLSDGVTVTFVTDTGHSTTDEWNFYACGALSSSNQYAYGWFRTVGGIGETLTSTGLTVLDEVIENGADITLESFQYGVLPRYNWIVDTTSSGKYNNIMEWYFREDIETKINNYLLAEGSEPFNSSDVWFMPSVLYNSTRGSAQYSAYNSDGFMTMVVKSKYDQNGFPVISGGQVRMSSTTNISQFTTSRLVFETDAINENTDIFHEIGQTYAITNNYHIGNGGSDINQSSGVSAEIILPVFNCFSWGNAVESYKVRDEFKSKSFKIDTRPSTPIENYRQNKRISSFTWSNVYEQTTNYNALNEFNLALANYKDLDDKYGSIQAMVSINTDLDVYQEDKVHQVLFDKVLIYNQDGSSNISKSDQLFDGVVPYSGEFGISTYPESLTIYGNYSYWADSKRGVFLRKGQSGIEIISNFGIRDWTRDAMTNLSTFIIGGYDPYFGQYVVSLNGQTLTFDEKVKGWTSFHSWIPDEIVRINNRFFTIKDGQMYLHNDETNAIYNTFYGTKYPSTIKTVFNEAPSEDKIFKNIVQEGNRPWAVSVSTNLSNGSIKATEFIQKESKWMAYMRKSESANLNGRVQGIGNILSINALEITFSQLPTLISVGEELYQLNASVQEEIGVITNIDRATNTITINAYINTPTFDYYAYTLKNARVQGAEIRGYYAEATLTNDDDGNAELFAINSNIVKSYVPTEIR
jgi:hypothetical protein